MTAQILEMAKVEYRDGFYLVLILSPVHGRWIVQGERRTRQAAELDLRNWR